jgi:hypothetical protein
MIKKENIKTLLLAAAVFTALLLLKTAELMGFCPGTVLMLNLLIY